MKIIKDARAEPWSRQTQCSDCRSVLEMEASDVRYIRGDQREPDIVYVSCPVCRARIYLDAGLLPPLVLKQAREQL